VPDPHRAPYDGQVRLREFLEQARVAYDVVLIDNPPNLHLCSWAALAAADAFVVPVQPEDFGVQGTPAVIDAAAAVRAVVNPGLALAGYVVSMFQARRAIHQAYVERLRATHGDAVFAAMVPEAVDFVEAVTLNRPVGQYKPRGAAAKAVRAVALELLSRLSTTAAGEAA
jgi:chromosome partitioning protein